MAIVASLCNTHACGNNLESTYATIKLCVEVLWCRERQNVDSHLLIYDESRKMNQTDYLKQIIKTSERKTVVTRCLKTLSPIQNQFDSIVVYGYSGATIGYVLNAALMILFM